MPIKAGKLNKRVTFQREQLAPDGIGGNALTWSPIAGLAGIPCRFIPERGRERLEAGRIEAAAAGILVVRSSEGTRGLTEKDRAVFDGVPHNIKSITNPDQRGRDLELVVERGVAQ